MGGWLAGVQRRRGFLVDEGKAQGIVALAILTLCSAMWVYLHIGYGAVYVVRGLHPTTGRYRCIYVGLTERPPWIDHDGDQRRSRIDEHIFGSTRYRQPCPPKVWADTAVDYYLAHESRWFLPGVLQFFESVNIKLRRPLYNDRMNRNNPHRIDAATARTQRAQRDQGIYTLQYLDALRLHVPFLLRRSE